MAEIDIQTDTLIIGCGIAGAAAALRLSDDVNHHVTVITRSSDAMSSNSSWAQGGIVTRGLDDSPDLLVEDILRAGAGLSSARAARILADEGPRLVQSVLIEHCGVRFDHNEDDELIYGLEAVHSTRRIIHVGDKTGEAIVRGMLATLATRTNVTLLTDHTAVDLITFPHHSLEPLDVYEPMTCHGAYVLDRNAREIGRVIAGHTILASGGLGQIYRNTTNPRGARGDGLAMAWRANIRVANAEYIQFHPTALSVRGAPNLLISEAVRGEGAVLLTPEGIPFMAKYDPEWRDLAPRDVVARAIHMEMLENGYEHVLLDIASKHPASFIRERFPQLVENCERFGLDPTNEPIPVVPAAHYFCGGVLVDDYGHTNFEGLYAVGEVSCTGLHGANRLASTSLLEGLVWGDRAARDILQHPRSSVPYSRIPEWIYLGQSDPDPALLEGDMTTIRNIMWHYVGLVRSEERLDRADRELRHLFHEIEAFYRTYRLNDAMIGLRNAIQTARIVTFSARRNRTSRGTHYRTDAPAEIPLGVMTR
ncbi:MAG TPA: L-aspartate oxidase [Phototrophicaceae bacterium]|jgi:L-aspartate oxidase|nr:L-aspartate oxidase [Phototrophicaceae bacterium]